MKEAAARVGGCIVVLTPECVSEEEPVCKRLWLALRTSGGARAGGSEEFDVGEGAEVQAIAVYTCKLRSDLLVRVSESNSLK
jgi:hypothetical protein